MLKRTIAICLLVLLSVGVLIPFANSDAHGVRQNSAVGHGRGHRYRSRAWWRRYRARLRKKRAAAELARRNALLALPQNLTVRNYTVVPTVPNLQQNPTAYNYTVVPNLPQNRTSRNYTVAPTVPNLRQNPTAYNYTVVRNLPQNSTARNYTVVPTVPNLRQNQTSYDYAVIPTVATTMSTNATGATRPRTVTAHVTQSLPTVSFAIEPKSVGTVPTTQFLANPSVSRVPTLINTPVPVAPTAVATRPAAKAEARTINNSATILPKNPVTPLPGQLSISVVALARPNPAFLTTREQSRFLAGISVTDLRRIVIDKMVEAGGWVTNDFVREINGARVFVVSARTPKDAQTPPKVWTFFFTESGGRIYSLTTDAPAEHADRMTREAERFIGTLQTATPAEAPKQ
jgi:hypothetical protein